MIGRYVMERFALKLFGPGTAGEPTAEDWARACGFEVVCAGKGTKYLPQYHQSTPDTVWSHYGFSREQLASGEVDVVRESDGQSDSVTTLAVNQKIAVALASSPGTVSPPVIAPPPPPPQAVINPLNKKVSNTLGVFIYRSCLLLIWCDINLLTGYIHQFVGVLVNLYVSLIDPIHSVLTHKKRGTWPRFIIPLYFFVGRSQP